MIPLAHLLELPVLLGGPLPSRAVGGGGVQGTQGGSRWGDKAWTAVYNKEFHFEVQIHVIRGLEGLSFEQRFY